MSPLFCQTEGLQLSCSQGTDQCRNEYRGMSPAILKEKKSNHSRKIIRYDQVVAIGSEMDISMR